MKKKGFTVLEISLYVALTGLIILGVIIATANNIARQRYNDSVQGVADYLRSAYSSVLYAKGSGDDAGRSGEVIYGKMFVFGTNAGSGDSTIYSYDIVGRAINSADRESYKYAKMSTLGLLSSTYINATVDYGSEESFTPLWTASVEVPDDESVLYRGALLVIRSPMYGTIYTFVYDGEISISDNIPLANFTDEASASHFQTKQLDICIDSSERTAAAVHRQDIRILRGGRNSSGITLVDVDSDDNDCKIE